MSTAEKSLELIRCKNAAEAAKLANELNELNEKRILSDAAKNYISIVRVYGNISSHYSDNVICKEEAIAIASSLLNVIDEIYERNLLGNLKLI